MCLALLRNNASLAKQVSMVYSYILLYIMYIYSVVFVDQKPHEQSGVPQGEYQGEVPSFMTDIRKPELKIERKLETG